MSTETRLQILERELARTTRHVRWLLAGLIVTVAWSVLTWPFAEVTVHAQPDARVVRARAFVLEDDNGANRAILAVTADGPGLALDESNGKPRATLGV